MNKEERELYREASRSSYDIIGDDSKKSVMPPPAPEPSNPKLDMIRSLMPNTVVYANTHKGSIVRSKNFELYVENNPSIMPAIEAYFTANKDASESDIKEAMNNKFATTPKTKTSVLDKLNDKWGPLPIYVWLSIAAAGGGYWWWRRSKKTST